MFIGKNSLPFELLSDPDKKVMTKYGAFGEKKMYGKKVKGVIRSTVWIGKDGKNHFYEVILVDPYHPVIINDTKINWVYSTFSKRRVLRGKTSAGLKGRGLRHKGRGAEKIRPSIRANLGRGK